MKKYVKASSDFNAQIPNYKHVYYGRQGYSIHYSNFDFNNPNSFKASIDGSHPYVLNDEDYAWARIGDGVPMSVKFIQKGKTIKKMQLDLYDIDEDYRIAPADILSERSQVFYDTDISEEDNIVKYYDYCICEIFEELKRINAGIKPIIDHT